jgi:hypothetical protein
MTTVASLESARDSARGAAAHPKVAELRAVLCSPTATTPEKRAAQEELIALRSERKALRETGSANLEQAQAALSAGRRAERAAAVEAIAVELRDKSTRELVELRASFEQGRRELKRKHRAIVKVLGERDAEQQVADMVSAMSDATKRALLQRLQAEGVVSEEAVGVPGR